MDNIEPNKRVGSRHPAKLVTDRVGDGFRLISNSAFC